jgi:hypothetical protein
MHFLLRLLFRPLGIMLASLVATWLGFTALTSNPEAVPERAALTSTSGTVTKASKITRKRTSHFEFEVKGTDGKSTNFHIPTSEISEDTVRSILETPVTVLSSGDRDIWQLTANDGRGDSGIITYETTKTKRIASNKDFAASGPYLLGGGVLALLASMLWGWRRGKIL